MPKMGKKQFDVVYISNGSGHYLKVPVLTTTQRDALTGIEGMVIFNSTTDQLEQYDGSTWEAVGQVILDTHIADLDAHIYNPMQTIRYGANEYNRLRDGSTLGNIVLTADTIYLIPFFVPRALTIQGMAIRVTTGDAGKIARLGIYENGTNCYPGDLVKDYATVSVASAAVVEAAGDQSLTKGLYFAAVVSDGTPTVRYAYTGWTPLSCSGSTLAPNQMWTKASVGSGALADPCVSGAALDAGSCPDVVFDIKSLD